MLPLVPAEKYLAISHVWSDGLGNQNGNSLPLCQLKRLKRNGPGKRVVLSRMNEVYECADAVLVLDEDLLLTTIHCSKEEKLLRILLSGWTRRLWTLEEGMLARKKLLFAFRDGIEGIPEASDLGEEKVAWDTQSVLDQVLPRRRVMHSAVVNTETDTADNRPWHTLLGAASYRSTSRNIDETICLSHILGLDVSDLVHITDERERMWHFFILLGNLNIKLPQNLLFFSGPKLPFPGFRWAPTSFIDIDNVSGEEEDGMGSDIGSMISRSGGEGCTWSPTGGFEIATNRLRRILSLPPGEPVKRAIFFKERQTWRVIVPKTGPVPEVDGSRSHWNDTAAARIFGSHDPVFRSDGPWAKLADKINGDGMLYLIQRDAFKTSGPAILASSSKGTKHTKALPLPQAHPYEVDLEVQVHCYAIEHGERLPKASINDTWEAYSEEMNDSLEENYKRYFRNDQCTLGSVEIYDAEGTEGYDWRRDGQIKWIVS
ncbi:hypothetical protein SLS58_006334 [Diplodia intermedia]|uniref:Heterokaryon incompatibility domain-containing protein n=1 Tax=Diplodia intermedia TaxID=856260 RepID=A0ABR3TNG6_9PEZI